MPFLDDLHDLRVGYLVWILIWIFINILRSQDLSGWAKVLVA